MPINRESRIENLWSSVTGATPDTGDFNYGELAINVVDKKVYFKDSTGGLSFIPADGITGSDGVTGRNSGVAYKYSTTTTTTSDPGFGNFRLNQSSSNIKDVTQVAIDIYDNQSGTTNNAWFESWDDSTSSHKGYLRIETAYPIYLTYPRHVLFNVNSVTAAGTATGGYYQIGVTYAEGSFPVANGTDCVIDFVRTGDKGDDGSVGSTGSTGSTGPQGTTGNGVTGFYVSGDNLYYWYADWTGATFGTLQNAGFVRGPTGPTGAAGTGGGGGAGTLTYAIFTPFYSEPPGLTYPTLDNRNTIAVLDFDSALDEETHFRGMIPHGATFSYLLTNIYWTPTTTGAGGTASWSIAYERMLGDINSDNFAQGYTGYSYYNPAGASSGVPLLLGITAQSVGGLGAGDPFRMRIVRNGLSDAADTLINDAELLLIEVRGVT